MNIFQRSSFGFPAPIFNSAFVSRNRSSPWKRTAEGFAKSWPCALAPAQIWGTTPLDPAGMLLLCYILVPTVRRWDSWRWRPCVDRHCGFGQQVTQQWHFSLGFILEAATWPQLSSSALVFMSSVYWQLHTHDRNVQVGICSDTSFSVNGTWTICWVSPKSWAQTGSFSWELFSCASGYKDLGQKLPLGEIWKSRWLLLQTSYFWSLDKNLASWDN